MHKVFVYGSLLSGMGNHSLLGTSKMLGETVSPKGFKMIDLGYFPGVVRSEGDNIEVVGEVYEVDDDTMFRLDRLEGYNPFNPDNGFYNRIEIDTNLGKAFMYIVNGTYAHSKYVVKNGDWKLHYKTKFHEQV